MAAEPGEYDGPSINTVIYLKVIVNADSIADPQDVAQTAEMELTRRLPYDSVTVELINGGAPLSALQASDS